jgi:alpha-tubulin suppressor-like RCC1 family protein
VAIIGNGPPQFGLQLGSVVAHAGGGVVLSAIVQGAYPLTLQWYHDGHEVAGATNRFLWLPACQPLDGGNYVLVATNPFGQTTNQPVNLAVHADPITISAVAAWGDNNSGQCTVSHDAVSPRAIAAGPFHALALNADGAVAAWGKNWDGQANVPPEATNVIAIAAGGYHSLALRDDGSLLAWGRNWDGQTNVPLGASNAVAIAAGMAHSVALFPDGTVLAWGNNDCSQTNIPQQAREAIAIAAGYYHSLALRSDHTVVAWGSQSTVPTSVTNVVAIAGGWWHSLALRADGSVVAWGDNSYAQCAVPDSATNIVGIAAGYSHSVALRADGTIITWGNGSWGVTNVPTGLGNVANIAAGQDYTVAIIELGPPRFNRPLEPAEAHVGGQVILSTSVSGTCPLALQWFHGDAAIGGETAPNLLLTNLQPGNAGTFTLIVTGAGGQTNSQSTMLTVRSDPAVAEVLTPQNVLIGTGVCLPAAVSGAEPLFLQWRLNGADLPEGGRTTGVNSKVLCLSATTGDDSGSYTLVVSNAYGSITGLVAQLSVSPILAWGDDSAGQLDVPIGTTDVVAVAVGGDHSLALRSDGSVVAWGDNSFGQSSVPQSVSSIVSLAAGDSHSLALRADGAVIAWGDSSSGQTNVPQSVFNVRAVAAGRSHSVALLPDGTVVAWGSNLSGQTNVPSAATNVIAIAAGGDCSLALRDDGVVIAWGNPRTVPASATNIVSVAAGGSDALALRDDGVLIPWGGNYYGQTAVPATATSVVVMAAGGDHNLVLLAGGSVAAWGANYFGQTMVPAQTANVVAISAGGAHNLALTGPPQANLQAAAGSSVLLTAGSLGGAGYQWQFNGMDIAGATNATFLVGPITRSSAGVYRVLVSNGLGLTIGSPTVLAVSAGALVFDTSPDGLQITNDSIHLRLLGASGLGPVVIYASSDLLNWQPIYTNPPVNGPLDFTDPGISNQPWRFYRASETR